MTLDKPKQSVNWRWREQASSLVVMISNQSYESSVRLLCETHAQAHAEGYAKGYREAKEDAARVAETWASYFACDSDQEGAAMVTDCAAAIRALSPNE